MSDSTLLFNKGYQHIIISTIVDYGSRYRHQLGYQHIIISTIVDLNILTNAIQGYQHIIISTIVDRKKSQEKESRLLAHYNFYYCRYDTLHVDSRWLLAHYNFYYCRWFSPITNPVWGYQHIIISTIVDQSPWNNVITGYQHIIISTIVDAVIHVIHFSRLLAHYNFYYCSYGYQANIYKKAITPINF